MIGVCKDLRSVSGHPTGLGYLACVPRRLATTALTLGKVNLDVQRMEEANGVSRCVGKEAITKTGDEKRDSHRLIVGVIQRM